MTKQHHLMKEIALAMKAKDFARAVQLYEDDDKGDTYEVHVYAGKSYFELKQHAKSRECYIKAKHIVIAIEESHDHFLTKFSGCCGTAEFHDLIFKASPDFSIL